MAVTGDAPDWASTWRGRWIWDHEPEVAYWWHRTPTADHFTYLRRRFDLAAEPGSLPVRVTCDARYVLHVNGELVGRGPVRSEPENLGWDTYDLAPHVHTGANVIVALCRYYGSAGPWWVPAAPLGTLGRGSFCLETAPGSPTDILTDGTWHAPPAAHTATGTGNKHAFPQEIIDGRRAPHGLHDPTVSDDRWPSAVLLSGRGHGAVLDRPPAAPYMSPRARPIPHLTSTFLTAHVLERDANVTAEMRTDPLETWRTVRRDEGGDRRITVWDLGGVSIGHVHLRVPGASDGVEGRVVDVVGGEDLREDGLPETRPRDWAGRYVSGDNGDEVVFFDPVGIRYLAVHHPPDVEVTVGFEESRYPRPGGAAFDCDDDRYAQLWHAGVRTVEVCSTDAFLDCPGREQRAWVSDAYPQILVSLVTNPDRRLVRHHLDLVTRSRLPSGLLTGAAACDFSHVGFTMPEYSLHWIRSLAAYWRYSGDDEFVGEHLHIADGIIERYEEQRGPSGLLENFAGWLFLDWAQLDRDVVTGAHDALYAAALEAYAGLPGAADVSDLIARTAASFEELWDADRHVYVDAIGDGGRSRRISQHTNGAALLAGIVPRERVTGVIERIVDPTRSGLGGRLVVTHTPATVADVTEIPTFQFERPDRFDEECDVVAAQPWFCRFLHEAWFRHGRRDLILTNLLGWTGIERAGTFQEFWDAEPGRASRCHGWAASPTYDLTSYVLGVRPATPGFERAVVDPYPGPLSRLSGRVPTPHGWLAVAIDPGGTDLEVPPGITVAIDGEEVTAGRVRLPFTAVTP